MARRWWISLPRMLSQRFRKIQSCKFPCSKTCAYFCFQIASNRHKTQRNSWAKTPLQTQVHCPADVFALQPPRQTSGHHHHFAVFRNAKAGRGCKVGGGGWHSKSSEYLLVWSILSIHCNYQVAWRQMKVVAVECRGSRWRVYKGRFVCLFLSEAWFVSHVFPGLEVPCQSFIPFTRRTYYLRQEIWTPVQLARNCGGRCTLSSKSEWLSFGWDVMDVDIDLDPNCVWNVASPSYVSTYGYPDVGCHTVS